MKMNTNITNNSVDTTSCTNSSISSPQIAKGAILITTSTFSILGSASIVIAVIIKEKLRNPEVRPLFHLSVADFLASSFWCLYGALTLYVPFGSICSGIEFCPYLQTILGCLVTHTWIFTILYAYEAYSRLTAHLSRRTFPRIDETSLRIFCVYAFAWICPVAVVCLFFILSLENGQPLHDETCDVFRSVPLYNSSNFYKSWTGIYQILRFAGLVISVASVMAFYISVRNSFRKIQISGGIMTRLQYDQEYTVKKWTCLYQVVFIICWLPSVVLWLCSFLSDFNLLNFYYLYIAQAMTAPLQGFFNCIIYGWRRSGFTRILKQKSYQSFSEKSSTGNTNKSF